MNYTLHQMAVFLKVTQTKSITKAAEELFLTQPAVSIQLKNFQAQFDVPLTEVIGRQVHVTDFGREVAAAAERILGEVEALHHQGLAFKGLLNGRLKVAVVSTGKYVMPYFLAGFVQQHPGIELQMDVTNRLRVLESLEKNEVDFALVSLLPDHMPLDMLPLMQNELFWVGRPGTADGGKPLSPSDLEDMSLIFREEGSGTRTVMQTFLDGQGLRVQKRLELSSNEAVKQAMLAGLGVSLMPLIGIKQDLLHGALGLIPMAGTPIRTTWHLVWRKNKRHSPVASAYLDFLHAEKDAIMQAHFSWISAFG